MARGAHKINPIGFRLGVNKNWKSRWYANKNDYADKFLSDIKVRQLVETKLKTAGVASVIVKRFINKTLVEVSVARPGVVIGRGGAGINALKDDLTKLLKQDVDVKIYEVKNPDTVAKLVAENIALQCEKRVNPQIAAAKAAEAAMSNEAVKGVQIWIGGRIKGADIARVVKVKHGVIPRHSLRVDLDYAAARAQVPALGVHGIKVWINKGEKTTYSID